MKAQRALVMGLFCANVDTELASGESGERDTGVSFVLEATTSKNQNMFLRTRTNFVAEMESSVGKECHPRKIANATRRNQRREGPAWAAHSRPNDHVGDLETQA